VTAAVDRVLINDSLTFSLLLETALPCGIPAAAGILIIHNFLKESLMSSRDADQ